MPAEAMNLPVGERTVRVSNPGKILFPGPGLTKADLVSYYVAAGEPMLTAIGGRPTTLRRFPDGVDGEFFYQKRVPNGAPPWVETIRIQFPSGRYADQICPTEVAVLAWAANLATIEFHPWPVRRPDVDHPDELRIDLDPQPGTSFGDVVAAAKLAREVLAEAGCTGFPKTSGGRGVHIRVRIAPEWTFTEVRRAAIALARELERRQPDRITAEWWKESRGERVFVDYNQTARDRTIAAAYSVRATPQATVSAPVTWDELEDVEPADFTIATMPQRLATAGDPHAGIDEAACRLDGLLALADADEHDRGLGDMPYPPDYPKMPGEPKRVQPSRARPATGQ